MVMMMKEENRRSVYSIEHTSHPIIILSVLRYADVIYDSSVNVFFCFVMQTLKASLIF